MPLMTHWEIFLEDCEGYRRWMDNEGTNYHFESHDRNACLSSDTAYLLLPNKNK
jgi:hypothetical protein